MSCARCSQLIDDENTVEWNNREYHEKCFKCFDCQISLKDQMTYANDKQFFCSNCIKQKTKKDKKMCDQCRKIFKANTRYTEYNGKYYHESCFTCASCHTSIVKQNFYPNEDCFLCEKCHEMTLNKCELCHKIITQSHVVIFQDKQYHDACMKCAKCKGEIGGRMCFSQRTTDGSFVCRKCDDDEK